MKARATPGKWFLRQRGIGWDGAATLALSNLALLATAGLSGLWLLYRVWRVACDTPVAGVEGDWIVVLGARLIGDRAAPGYATSPHRCRFGATATLATQRTGRLDRLRRPRTGAGGRPPA